MPDFTYDGEPGLYFPTLPPEAASPEPGETYTLSDAPADHRWVSKTATVAELREQAEALDVDTKGLKKAELEAAIAQHAAEPVVTEPEPESAEPAQSEES